MKKFLNLFKQNKAYVSEIDQFLAKFDLEHPERSPAQKYEQDKAARIAKLRDDADAKLSKDLFDFE